MMKNFRTFIAVSALLATCFTGVARAQDQPPAQEMSVEELEKQANFQYQTGTVMVGEGLATLNLGPDYRFLGPADSSRLLTDYWGNPPSETLGMILPAHISPMSDESRAVVITYDNDGHVKDKDAEKINYAKLLKEMQKGSEQANAERVKLGYETVDLVGWAEEPHYDAASKKLYWAKELKFQGSEGPNTLNYNVRVLGRTGVLNLNAVAAMPQLGEIRPAMEGLLPMVEFNPGNRYADFDEKVDKVAAYGIAGLVAGGAAAKVGLFKGLFMGLLALKKFGIILVIAVVAGLGKIFGMIFGKKSAG